MERRRSFIKGALLVSVSALAGATTWPGCKQSEGEDKEVSPPEDLMQEHGLLNRVLLIYDTCRTRLETGVSFPRESLSGAAGIIRTFVEDYHEKQEENYLFPRFRKANRLTDLVDTLLAQHQAGRALTDRIIRLAGPATLSDSEKAGLIGSLAAFNQMYRPHEAREDTVLFPAFRQITSRHEYASLGEEFENNEHKLFGKDGFETMVEKVAHIERALGIYDLAQFTPKIGE
ncbi:MAG: hemerythrin domain-containing protein [Bacteroidota bacterium]|nr:hemerythrin domain-containing protein [Bacteroidota bacterium]